MAHFQRSITIDAPPHAVYEHWSDPHNWPEVRPSLIEVTDLVTTPDGHLDGRSLEAGGDGTKLAVDVEYTIPVPVLGKLMEPFVLKANEHEAEATLANAKARMEHRA